MLVIFEGLSNSLRAPTWNGYIPYQWSVLAARVNENLEAAGNSAAEIIYP